MLYSYDMLDEIQYAHTTKKRIIPFLLDDTPIMVGQFGYYLARRQCINAYPKYEEHLQELLYALTGKYGFDDGDKLFILEPAFGGGGEGVSPSSTNILFTFSLQSRKEGHTSKQEHDETNNYGGGTVKGAAIGSGVFG